MPNVVSVVIKCSFLSAVEARSSWEGVSPLKVSTETCNTFATEDNVEIWFGYEGAKAVPSEGRNMVQVDRSFGLTGQGPILPIFWTSLFEAQSKIEDLFLFEYSFDGQVILLYGPSVEGKSSFCYKCLERLDFSVIWLWWQ